MTFDITKEGDLLFLLSDLRDWKLFENIVVDAQGSGEGWLAKRLGVLMDDEDWDEYVAPSLSEQFQGDIALVSKALRESYEEFLARPDLPESSPTESEIEDEEAPDEEGDFDEDEEDEVEDYGKLLITKETSGAWYSVFNQARLALEGKWKLSALEAEEDEEILTNIEPERIAAHFRYDFYSHIQWLLLNHLMEL